MRSITDKLIYEGSEARNIKINVICLTIGISLFILSFICFELKTMYDDIFSMNEHMDERLLLQIAGLCIVFCGLIVFAVTGLSNTIKMLKVQSTKARMSCLGLIIGSIALKALCLGILGFVFEASASLGAIVIFLILYICLFLLQQK